MSSSPSWLYLQGLWIGLRDEDGNFCIKMRLGLYRKHTYPTLSLSPVPISTPLSPWNITKNLLKSAYYPTEFSVLRALGAMAPTDESS